MKTLPPIFIKEIESYNDPIFDGLTDALAITSPIVSVRANRRKGIPVPPDAERVPWCGRGWYLKERPLFTLDPALHQGRYYVQDASSMIIGEIVRRLTGDCNLPLIYLDACAAPGGKTTAAIDSLPDGSLVVANEFDYRRAEILKENVMKWGYPAVIVSRGDTSRFRKLKDTFDIIAADVPCSGEGMFRKDDEAIDCWSPELVEKCVERQREIVGNLWTALAPGGYFIYSTCTFNRRENEEMVDYMVETFGAESVSVDLSEYPDIAPGVDTSYSCFRFMPHRTRGEGLFVAVLRKSGEWSGSRTVAKPAKSAKDKTPKLSLPGWTDGCTMIVDGDTVSAVVESWEGVAKKIGKELDIILNGVEVGVIKGRDIIPSQGLALSSALATDAFPRVEVDRETALTYLRRESVTLPDGTPRGHVLLMYENVPLGFVKNLGNRSNNLYPQNWRILKKS